MIEPHSVPNHHRDHPGFSGLAGLVAALSMIIGRDRDAELAVRLSGIGPGDVVVDVGCGPGSRPATRPVSARASPESIRRRSCCASHGC